MLPVLFWALVFVASLAVLVKASDYFTDSAERIGISFGISPFIIGVTIVAVGTSTPELVSSVLAVVKGSSEIVAGN
ncbi:MAG: sodium:calcium antiporter, partial [Methanothrix sp.]